MIKIVGILILTCMLLTVNVAYAQNEKDTLLESKVFVTLRYKSNFTTERPIDGAVVWLFSQTEDLDELDYFVDQRTDSFGVTVFDNVPYVPNGTLYGIKPIVPDKLLPSFFNLDFDCEYGKDIIIDNPIKRVTIVCDLNRTLPLPFIVKQP